MTIYEDCHGEDRSLCSRSLSLYYKKNFLASVQKTCIAFCQLANIRGRYFHYKRNRRFYNYTISLIGFVLANEGKMSLSMENVP